MKDSLLGKFQSHFLSIPVLFLLARLIIFASLPYEVIPGYGDYWNFFQQAGLGVPFLDFWTEFPPLFPFISRILYLLSRGKETVYNSGLAVILTSLQAVNIWLVIKISGIVRPAQDSDQNGWIYLVLTVGLFYTWSYFDTLAIFFLLSAVYMLLQRRDGWAAAAISLGALTKWFPLLVLPAIWKIRPARKALVLTAAVLGCIGLAWGGLYILNPEFTGASLLSQINKGSWETVWALLDGNLHTGNFSPQIDRLIPDSALIPTGNPAVIPAWLTLGVMGGFGLYILIRSQPGTKRWLVDFLGLTIVLFFLWSPGYSPQWVMYLIPIALISFEKKEATLFGAVLVLVHLLEWPILLSRGEFQALWYLIPLRTLIIGLLGWRFYQLADSNTQSGWVTDEA